MSPQSHDQQAPARVQPVCIPYAALVENADTGSLIEQAFGQEGLGILTVSGVPDFAQLREQLLPLADAFATLPAEVRAQYEDASSSYSFGWSHGKEAMASGRRDVLKGSYYANPTVDVPQARDADDAARYAGYMRPNIWPTTALPQLEGAFKALGRRVVDVGLLLAAHCDRYLASRLGPDSASLRSSLAASQCHKGRLLHYFPARDADVADGAACDQGDADADAAGDDAWCGWHRDHGALTGLCSALYMQDGRTVSNPDPASGLYIRTRGGAVVQAPIPEGHIAYQIGQALAIQSGGLLQATPHCVRVARGRWASRVSRNTFAVFMQPDVHCKLSTPAGRALDALLAPDQGRWYPGMSFGEFAESTLRGYYGAGPAHAVGKSPVRPAAAAAAAAAAATREEEDGPQDAPARKALRVFVVHE